MPRTCIQYPDNYLWWNIWRKYPAWKVSKDGPFSGPYFPVFGLNTKIYGANLRIQSEYRKIRTRKNSVFGHFSRSDSYRLKAFNYFRTKFHLRCFKGFWMHLCIMYFKIFLSHRMTTDLVTAIDSKNVTKYSFLDFHILYL